MIRERPIEFELQRSQGDLVEGPFDVVLLREWLYAGRLTGRERVRPVGQSFVQITDLPEFKSILDTFGTKKTNPSTKATRRTVTARLSENTVPDTPRTITKMSETAPLKTEGKKSGSWKFWKK